MSELTYTSGVTGQVFDLESKLSWGAALGLRSREWDYSLTTVDWVCLHASS